jgi:hypothetical protein
MSAVWEAAIDRLRRILADHARDTVGLKDGRGEPRAGREPERPGVPERLVLGEHHRHELIRVVCALRRLGEAEMYERVPSIISSTA